VETAGVEPAVPEAADLQSTGVTNFPTSPKTYKNTLTFPMSLLAMCQPNVFIYALQPPAVNYILNSATPSRYCLWLADQPQQRNKLDLIRYTTGLVIALPAPVGVRLGPPVCVITLLIVWVRLSSDAGTFSGRSTRDRTSDLLVPNQAHYQAVLYSELFLVFV
jgi:hypothetical protein